MKPSFLKFFNESILGGKYVKLVTVGNCMLNLGCHKLVMYKEENVAI